ncbi:Potassium voltage-gated channel subfamily F member 1 [Paramuricea clavata]|uniref:Potassium voltage-gated channel subfamily F member 1 n=1 Tax=Paramuricea clavata TaxID=317549 RepID=A0A7D9HZ73_PARCT|nr:Potassium voltage-gated channel subfamily F member 1 [Paramuricea clavata]
MCGIEMRWYRTITSVITLLTACIAVQAIKNCPSNITINSKGYFEAYLKILENGSTSGIFPRLLTVNVSRVCCGGEQNISIRFVNETTRTSVRTLLYLERETREGKPFDNTTLDFYFPAYTTTSEATEVYKEFHFIEIVKSPGPAFIMLIDELQEAPDPSVVLIECWPIFVLLLVMAWVVGIIGWFLDRSKNEQFPENFYRGSWVGFWWAVVTMTTVGYGDKAPKSFAARVITILWMITGTIVTSLFTANVTTVLTTKNVAALQNVLGQKVGVLNSKQFFQREINEGASFIEYYDQETMYTAFDNRKISRILAPNYLDHLYFATKEHLANNFVIARVVKHPFSVGLGLVDDKKQFGEEMMEFLRCWERQIINNFEEDGLDYSVIDPSLYHTAENARSLLNQKSILNLIYGLLVLLFIFLVTGSLWEFWKRSNARAEKMTSMEPVEIEMTKRASPTLSFDGKA